MRLGLVYQQLGVYQVRTLIILPQAVIEHWLPGKGEDGMYAPEGSSGALLPFRHMENEKGKNQAC